MVLTLDSLSFWAVFLTLSNQKRDVPRKDEEQLVICMIQKSYFYSEELLQIFLIVHLFQECFLDCFYPIVSSVCLSHSYTEYVKHYQTLNFVNTIYNIIYIKILLLILMIAKMENYLGLFQGKWIEDDSDFNNFLNFSPLQSNIGESISLYNQTTPHEFLTGK